MKRIYNISNYHISGFKIERIAEKKHRRRFGYYEFSCIAFNNPCLARYLAEKAASDQIFFGDSTHHWRIFDPDDIDKRESISRQDDTALAGAHVYEGVL